MPVAIQQAGSSNRESDIDKILKGIQIASHGLGIAVDVSKLAGSPEEDLKKQQLTEAQRHARGEYTATEYAKLGFSPLAAVPQAPGAEGAAPGAGGLSSGPPRPTIGIAGGPPIPVPTVRGKLMQPDGSIAEVDLVDRKLLEDMKKDVKDKRDFEQKEREIEAHRADRAEGRNKPSEFQSKSAGYGKAIEQAQAAFTELTDAGYNRADPKTAANSAIPGFVTSLFPKYGESPENQRQRQAEQAFINAKLRVDSGATISPSEYANAEKQYLPRAGDSPEVLAQKAENRAQVLESFKSAAGPAWERTPTVAHKPGGTKEDGGGRSVKGKAADDEHTAFLQTGAQAEIERRRREKGKKS